MNVSQVESIYLRDYKRKVRYCEKKILVITIIGVGNVCRN